MKNVITMSQFQSRGRGINQCFRYMFLEKYSREYGAELQLPAWVGNGLFGLESNPITEKLPEYCEKGGGRTQPTPPTGAEIVNHDFVGHAQYHTSYFAWDRLHIRRMFRPVRSIEDRMAAAGAKLAAGGVTTVGIHIRRGDYGRRIFPLVPVVWYQKWLRNHTDRLGDFRLFIATEDPSVIPEFSEWAPECVETLGIDLAADPMADCTYLAHDLQTHDTRAMDWYPDFHLLSQCDVVLGGSSTFSFFAAMLNPDLREYWRASLEAEQFVATDPWDAYPILREDVRDYPHLDGITSSPDNAYWKK